MNKKQKMMTSNIEMPQRDIMADYWSAYFEWRSQYGLGDECMRELIAAIRVEADRATIESDQQARLMALANMIEVELEGLAMRAA